MTEKEFIRLPAEIHIKSNADGGMDVMICGDAMKTAYLVTEAVRGIFEEADMAAQVDIIENVTTDVIHDLARKRKEQLKRPSSPFGQHRSTTVDADELRRMPGFIFGGK